MLSDISDAAMIVINLSFAVSTGATSSLVRCTPCAANRCPLVRARRYPVLTPTQILRFRADCSPTPRTARAGGPRERLTEEPWEAKRAVAESLLLPRPWRPQLSGIRSKSS